MPRSKKPRRPYQPRPASFDAMTMTLRRAADRQAHARATRSEVSLQRAEVMDLAIAYHGAMRALSNGQATDDDVEMLALACNVALLLCEAGLGADCIEHVRLAQDAVVQVKARAARCGPRYVHTALEMQRLNALLELHDAQLEHPECTEGLMVRVLDEIKKRIANGDVLEVVPA